MGIFKTWKPGEQKFIMEVQGKSHGTRTLFVLMWQSWENDTEKMVSMEIKMIVSSIIKSLSSYADKRACSEGITIFNISIF